MSDTNTIVEKFGMTADEIAKQLEKKAEERTKELTALAVILVANGILNYITSFLTGGEPITFNAVATTIFLIVVYLIIIMIRRYLTSSDLKIISQKLIISEKIREQQLIERKKDVELGFYQKRHETDLDLRKDMFKQFITRGVTLFAAGPEERQDWECMSAAFTKTVADLDKQLSQNDKYHELKEVVDTKFPKLAAALEITVEKLLELEKKQVELESISNDRFKKLEESMTKLADSQDKIMKILNVTKELKFEQQGKV